MGQAGPTRFLSQHGAVSGIDANTGVALWIGTKGAPGPATTQITIVSVVPEPSIVSQLACYGLGTVVALSLLKRRSVTSKTARQ
jgi:hypothetical protein